LVQEGATWLAVSNVDEGIALRQAGNTARILVMADFLREDREALSTYGLTPVLHSLEDVAAVSVPYHLKIDTAWDAWNPRRAGRNRSRHGLFPCSSRRTDDAFCFLRQLR